MRTVHFHSTIVLFTLLLAINAGSLPAHKAAKYRHQHIPVGLGPRQPRPPIVGLQPEVTPRTSTSPGRVLTTITPSPGAVPVAVTKENQIVLSYIPQFTLCELHPIAFFPISSAPSAKPSSTPYLNYSVLIPPGNSTCTTMYSSTNTMVCATTITGLVDKYTVTNCNQALTFSTKYGYDLAAPMPTPTSNSTFSNVTNPNSMDVVTPGPSIETVTTYFQAPWQELTAGTVPGDVELKVCRNFTNGTTECIREYQVWEKSLITRTATSISSVNISTTISGPSQILVETIVANVTELFTTFSMSTTLEIDYQTEYTTTHSTPMPVSTGPTVYETLTVEEVSRSKSTRTTTIHITSTVYVTTSTVTVSSSTAPASTS